MIKILIKLALNTLESLHMYQNTKTYTHDIYKYFILIINMNNLTLTKLVEDALLRKIIP